MNTHFNTLFARAAALLALLLCATFTLAQCPGQWLPGPGYPGINGPATAAIWWDPDGPGPLPPRLVVGGTFTATGSTLAQNVAMWDGQAWSPMGDGFVVGNYSGFQGVSAFAEYNGSLLAAGCMFDPNSIYDSAGVLRWTGSAWESLGPLYGLVTSMVVFSGDLYASGYIDLAGNGNWVYRVVRWNGSSWSAVSDVFSDFIASLTIYNGQVVALGSFTRVGTVNVPYAAALNDGAWTALGSPTAALRAPLVHNGSIYAADLTGTGQPCQVRRLTGSTWTPFGAPTRNPIYAMTEFAGQITVAATYSSFNGVLVPGVASLDDAGTWHALGTGMSNLDINATAYCLAPADNTLFAGGFFQLIDGCVARSVASWDGSHWSALAGAQFIGTPLGTVDGEVIAAGNFTRASEQPPSSLARLTPDGWTSIAAPVRSRITAATEYNGQIVGVGPVLNADGSQFGIAAGIENQAWVRLGFPGSPGETAGCLVVFGPDLIVGGGFSTAANVPAQRVARWDGSIWHAMGAGLPGTVNALHVHNGQLYAAFDNSVAQGPSCVAVWTGSNWLPVGATTGPDNSAIALATFNGSLYAAGNFVASGSPSMVARLDGADWVSVADRAESNSAVYNFDLYNGALLAVGRFSQINGQPMSNVATFDGSSWSALPTSDTVSFPTSAVVLNGMIYTDGVITSGTTVKCFSPSRWTEGTADFNHDGDPATDADIEAFFACLAGNCCPTCGSADFNGDGDYATDADIEAFFRVLAGGSC